MKLRRIIAAFVIFTLLLGVIGCTKNTENNPTENPPTEAPETPEPDPLSLEEAYDVSFNLPITEQTNKVDTGDYGAVDGLGRTLSANGDSYSSTLYSGTVGNSNSKKFVGIFYSDWHAELAKTNGTNNVTKILSSLSEEEREIAKHDFSNKVWKKKTGYHFWDEPIYGYYSTTDKYVLRKQAELLADAGVDCIIFDNTNGTFLWESSFMAIFETFTQARKEGVHTPQIVFMLPFAGNSDAREQLQALYTKVYSKGLYQDLWFMWEGKPLIMAYPEALTSSKIDQEIKNFFTFRRNDGSYFVEDRDCSHWGWLSTYPQTLYKNSDGTVEQVTVGVAQNADYKRQKLSAMSGYNIMGRSYTKGDYSYTYNKSGITITVDKNIENSKYYGLNFQQQWDYAISNNPEFIFVTGWNEWIAMRMGEWAGDTSLNGTNIMVDQFDTEYSRDCEPSTGEMKDYYYYQLAENIRRFKGASVAESKAVEKDIDIGGKISQWSDVPSYNTYVNSTWERSKENGSRGYGSKVLKNEVLMRNDIVTAKVAYNDKYVFFYADCANEITSYTDEAWMRLFINTDSIDGKGADWEGFEYVINRVNPTSDSTCVLEKSTGGWNFQVVGEVSYVVRKNVIQIRVPREMLGLGTGDLPEFGFKWCDNNLFGDSEGDIMSLYTGGEAAPGGRFYFKVKGKR